ncbi:hypothetical protein CEN49_25730 [Fischerella thermalis CCMEE 5273]|nr:hypothetical protein CEN49_25730 [Fischerella thermalis CCMEE 5273]
MGIILGVIFIGLSICYTKRFHQNVAGTGSGDECIGCLVEIFIVILPWYIVRLVIFSIGVYFIFLGIIE